MAEVTPQYGKPTLVCQMALGEMNEDSGHLDQGQAAPLHFPEEAARAMGAMARYAASIQPTRHEVKCFYDVDREALRNAVGPGPDGGPTSPAGTRGP